MVFLGYYFICLIICYKSSYFFCAWIRSMHINVPFCCVFLLFIGTSLLCVLVVHWHLIVVHSCFCRCFIVVCSCCLLAPHCCAMCYVLLWFINTSLLCAFVGHHASWLCAFSTCQHLLVVLCILIVHQCLLVVCSCCSSMFLRSTLLVLINTFMLCYILVIRQHLLVVHFCY